MFGKIKAGFCLNNDLLIISYGSLVYCSIAYKHTQNKDTSALCSNLSGSYFLAGASDCYRSYTNMWVN